MWWTHGDWGWGGWLLMTLGMVGVWSVLIWAVLAMVRDGSGRTPLPDPTAGEILDRRLARGEIGEAEYRRCTEVLRERGSERATHGVGAP